MAGAVRIEREGDIAVIVIDNPPANATSWDVRQGLFDAVATVAADAGVTAAIIIGAGSTFVAGADIREFGQPPRDPQLPAVIAAIEACAKPVVAAIHGAALGGGFELALGCDARIADAKAVVGLPEVTLGIIPGAGGTQRLPRLVGVSAAIEMIVSGRRLKATEAQDRGAIDKIAEGDLRADAVAFAKTLHGKRRVSERAIPPESAEAIEAAATAALRRAKPAAARDAIAMVRASATMPFADAIVLERETFQRLRVTEEAAALRYLFFAEREAARVPGLEQATERKITTAGVVGGGIMGAGIAVCLLDAGLPVTLIERDETALTAGRGRIAAIYARAVEAGRMEAGQADKRLEALTASTRMTTLADADLVIEAVFEDMAVKQALFRDLDGVMKRGAILASNTSYLDLDALAGKTARPQDVVGLHFFSPAHVMRLLEVVRTTATAPDVLRSALSLAKRISKLPVVARVGEGFIGNRIYSAYRTQCEFMLEDGALPHEVDKALTDFGMAMGPFAVGDLSGLEIAWKTRQRLAPTRKPGERVPGILDRLCEAGRFGQKSGAGWYRYGEDARRGAPDDAVTAIIEAASREKGIVRRAFTAEEIVWRAIAAMVNEAALLLAEGIALRASDVDLMLVNGYGFPSTKGGPLFWASCRDRREVDDAQATLAAASGPTFRTGDVAGVLDGLRG